jgi:hypothetical protein
MAHFRLEAEKDETSGKWHAALYYPSATVSPVSRTRPIFNSSDEALAAALRAMQNSLEHADHPT